MAKIAIKSEKYTPFEGRFSIIEQIDSKLSFMINPPWYEAQAERLSLQRKYSYSMANGFTHFI